MTMTQISILFEVTLTIFSQSQFTWDSLL